MALLYGLITALAFGAGDYIAGQVTKRVPTLLVVLYAQAFGAVVMLPAALVSGHLLSVSAVIWGLLGGLSLGLGFLLYFHALSLGKMGVVSSIAGILSAVIPVAAGLLIGERPGTAALAAIAMIILSIFLISKKDANGQTGGTTPKVLLQSAAAGVLLGGFFIFLHIPASGESMWTVFFTMTGSFLGVAVLLIVRRADIRVKKQAWPFILGNGFLQTFGAVTYVAGVNIGLMSIVALAGALSPLFTVIFARLLIQEYLNKFQISGILVALSGIALLVVTT
jgi:drug/metabolite transporter (DMT)-like permease